MLHVSSVGIEYMETIFMEVIMHFIKDYANECILF